MKMIGAMGPTYLVQLARALRMPIRAKHAELSVISSLDDAPGISGSEFIDTTLTAGTRALSLELPELCTRTQAATSSPVPGRALQILSCAGGMR
jgi:hypothetical protein